MRLSYHGWAAVLLVLSFALFVAGALVGMIPTTPPITLPGGDTAFVNCGSPWAPSGAPATACTASFGERGTIGLVLVCAGLLLFGGQLLVGFLIAGIRHALAEARPADTPVAPPAD